MPDPRDFLPPPPWEGPPVPRALLKTEPDPTSSPPPPPAPPGEPPAAPARTPKTGEPVLVMRTYRDPTWLKEHQEKMARLSKQAAEKTRHLKGAKRVTVMNRIISDLWRGEGGPGS